MVDQPLSDIKQQDLRARGVINANEIAIKVGDLHIALHSVTGERRAIVIVEPVTETKQILRG